MFTCFDFDCSAADPFQRTLPLAAATGGVAGVGDPAADRQLSVTDLRQLSITLQRNLRHLWESKTLNIWADNS